MHLMGPIFFKTSLPRCVLFFFIVFSFFSLCHLVISISIRTHPTFLSNFAILLAQNVDKEQKNDLVGNAIWVDSNIHRFRALIAKYFEVGKKSAAVTTLLETGGVSLKWNERMISAVMCVCVCVLVRSLWLSFFMTAGCILCVVHAHSTWHTISTYLVVL